MEAKEELYQELLNKGQQLLAVTPEGSDSNTEQDLASLKDKWESVQGKVAERKVCERGLRHVCAGGHGPVICVPEGARERLLTHTLSRDSALVSL